MVLRVIVAFNASATYVEVPTAVVPKDNLLDVLIVVLVVIAVVVMSTIIFHRCNAMLVRMGNSVKSVALQ